MTGTEKRKKLEKDKTESSLGYLKNEIEGSDRIAAKINKKYAEKISIKYLYDRQNRFIIDFLKNQKLGRLVELGCGIGNFLTATKPLSCRVLGIDPGVECLKIAKELVPDAHLGRAQGENLPLADCAVDAIVMKGVVHHLRNPVKVFKEVYRCLKPGGILVIFEGNRSSPYRRVVLGLADLLNYDHESSLYEHRTPRVMKEMMVKSKLEPFYCQNISGLFAPLALVGFGFPWIWKVCGAIEDNLQRICPFVFNYYTFLAARKVV